MWVAKDQPITVKRCGLHKAGGLRWVERPRERPWAAVLEPVVSMSKPQALTYLSLHMFSLIESLSKFEYRFDIETETVGGQAALAYQPFKDGPGMHLRVPGWRGGRRTIVWSGFDVETASSPPGLF